MLGSLSEAEDAVQESWLRLSRADTDRVENLGGWLTTVVSRVCLDMLRSRKSRREEPIGVQVRGASTWAKQLIALSRGMRFVQPALINGSVGLILAPRHRCERRRPDRARRGGPRGRLRAPP